MLKVQNSSGYWYRKTTDTLIEFVDTSLHQGILTLSRNSQARKAFVEIAAVLAARNIPIALFLQE
ncbi:hypothetical protein MNBD_GAMMA11-2681 [hydrothermal vent metagenome]|uniref:Uncharacterized protein n=1 Tax=hydrothermal vent metagenome TaxID=652676 RepID=A0A3B0X1U8_9ZZZZ